VSYILKVQNGSHFTWYDGTGTQVNPGDGWNAEGKTLGSAFLSCNERGGLSFLDIGDTHIPGDSKQTWGVLISYQGEEFVGRYEGGGQLSAQINHFGQVQLGGNMDFRQVSLSAFIQPDPTFE
jgi:hypothetical protein